MAKKINYRRESPFKEFWDKGFVRGVNCRQHPERIVQEEWMRLYFKGKVTYEQFKEYWRGYLFGKSGREYYK